MIGARFSARRGSLTPALLALGSGVLLFAFGMLTGASVLVSLAAAPLAIGISLLLVGERGFRARFTPTALEVAGPRQVIRYASLLAVRPLVPLGRPRPACFAIQVVHANGSLVIPPRLTVSSERVYSFLKGFVAERPVVLPPELDDYRVEQEGRFGPEKVWCYVGSRAFGPPPRARSALPIAVGLLSAAAIWAVIPFARPGEPAWWLAAIPLAIGGGGLLVQELVARQRQTIPKAAADTTSALVIAPLGLAVQQGDTSGHLAWPEIRRVSLRRSRGSLGALSSAQSAPGIVLEIEGASIVLPDTYDRPLSEIHERLLRYWR